MIQNACNITEKGFRRVLGFVKPGVWEYNIEAEFIHEFLTINLKDLRIANHSSGIMLTLIILKTINKEGDLILFDVAAEYANYSSDMSRTIPVSGDLLKGKRQYTKL